MIITPTTIEENPIFGKLIFVNRNPLNKFQIPKGKTLISAREKVLQESFTDNRLTGTAREFPEPLVPGTCRKLSLVSHVRVSRPSSGPECVKDPKIITPGPTAGRADTMDITPWTFHRPLVYFLSIRYGRC